MTNFLKIPSSVQYSQPSMPYPKETDKNSTPAAMPVSGELPVKIGNNGGVINGENGSNGSQNSKISDEADKKRRFDSFECQTCKNRRYQDGSDDMGVSFQNPTKVNPRAAAAAVRGHEQEHVTRNRAKAQREGKEIVSQSVTIHTGICPECGKIYVSGGTTRTSTRSTSEDKNQEKFNVGLSDPEEENGNMLNAVA